MSQREIPYYNDYISENFQKYLNDFAKPYPGVPELIHLGATGGVENKESLKFVCDLYDKVKVRLNIVLESRIKDREFIDQRAKAYYEFNSNESIDLLDEKYRTVLGDEDNTGRIVVGPKLKNYCGKSEGQKVAPIPEHLEGFHVTLFGPPDDAKLSINAMNAYHRKLKDEPKIIEEILKTNQNYPKWGADDEDSKTPLRSDLISASKNLTDCFNGDIKFVDEKRNKTYELESDKLSQPIKRFPGLALPTSFMFYRGNPLPLHLYDFALHLFLHWKNPKALTFYVPKLENEEEASYIKYMIETAEKMIKDLHPEYILGTVRVIIVLENPRAVFRVNEIMDELYPYFVGASLGWHDYLGSTARLFREDGNYRIPVKADPDIVIKYIKASHELLANVVGERGGIKIGGMYGILPIDNDLFSDSFQITIRGFFRDVITQLKRDLSGYWVAHPDFIRIGIAIVEAWRLYTSGDELKLKGLIHGLLNDKYSEEIWDFVKAADIESLDMEDALYARSLIVADIKESNFIANNHPDEIRYNVFQMLQYLTDWLSGNGCVALPTEIKGIPARVMDDLATAERSRWEVWHEIHYGRFSVEDFIKIAHEEMNFIRRDLSDSKKIVQIKYNEENAKWYDVAFKLMIQLMTSSKPVEFATELLLPFTIDEIRAEEKPWDKLALIDPTKYMIEDYINRYNYYFEMCGAESFALSNAKNLAFDENSVRNSILNFSFEDVLSAASFHGDIGQSLKTLDSMAKTEQKSVAGSSIETIKELQNLTKEYLEKFKMKFLVSAKDKSADDLLEILKERINNSKTVEIENAKNALLEITLKRISAHPFDKLKERLEKVFNESNVMGCQIGISTGIGSIQTLSFGKRDGDQKVDEETQFQIASLSKTYASVIAHEFFRGKDISLETSVNKLLKEYGSDYLIPGEYGDDVCIHHLMSHSALNMHYVNGVSSSDDMPSINEFLRGHKQYQYDPIEVANKPGTIFKYSGAGFILLEYLIELVSRETISDLSHYDLGHRPSGDNFAKAFTDNKELLSNGYKMFPTFAAGMWSDAHSVLSFLEDMTFAYHNLDGCDDISHDTSIQMTHGFDKGCLDFMNAKMGHGVFLVEGGDNQYLLHQGANDGYRAIYLYCYNGPAKYTGVCILCNGELNGVLLNSKLLQEILLELNLAGIDYSKFKTNFSTTHLSQEEIVNIGYKNLVLDAFLPTLPEEIKGEKNLHPLSSFNKILNAKIIKVSDQKFARAENLISPFEPVFDPTEFGSQGKIMDSWETARHNQNSYDSLFLKLKERTNINYISISTKFHDGNQVEWIEILSKDTLILEKTQLAGHAERLIKLDKTFQNIDEVEVRAFPDGGLTRLGLFESIPETMKNSFKINTEAQNIRFSDIIPKTLKTLGPDPLDYSRSDTDVDTNWASLAVGAKIISAGDEHYAPAINVLSPYPPINMFDGLESKRSRTAGHKEELIIELPKIISVESILFDFKYFVNNNPAKLSIFFLKDDHWIVMTDLFNCKPYAGNQLKISIKEHNLTQRIKFNFFPDGGVNRIKVFGKAE